MEGVRDKRWYLPITRYLSPFFLLREAGANGIFYARLVVCASPVCNFMRCLSRWPAVISDETRLSRIYGLIFGRARGCKCDRADARARCKFINIAISSRRRPARPVMIQRAEVSFEITCTRSLARSRVCKSVIYIANGRRGWFPMRRL